MIVKNESRNMRRLLNSLIGIIDFGSIVDTGSTDNTIEVIENWARENKMKILVHKEPFRNFSYNRTHSFVKAKLSFPEADYFLLSDADFIWIKKPGFDKSLLNADFYNIYQGNKHIDYTNIRLISSKYQWVCTGLTHEYWEVKKGSLPEGYNLRYEVLYSLYINDIEDGGCKQDKFIRDERLLLEGLRTEKRQDLLIRYKFYLAQTYRDTEQYLKSIEMYKKHSEESTWQEEKFYSIFMIGECNNRLALNLRRLCFLCYKSEPSEDEKQFIKKWNPENLSFEELLKESRFRFSQAIEYHLKAFKFRPHRAEPLIRLSRILRYLALFKEAYIAARIAFELEFPSQDVLFIERDCYSFLPALEIIESAYYLSDKKDEAKMLMKYLLDKEDLPNWARIQLLQKAIQYC
jgi:glycosyltransferase involved in cell wall biosynthesis